MSIEYTTPPCRIVWGSPVKARPVIDDRTKQPKTDKDGNPRMAIEFGVAIPKTEAQPMLDAMGQAASADFPSGFPGNYAWKYRDGDTGVDAKGRPLRDKEGQAGCYILSCRTELIGQVGRFEFDHATQKWVPTNTIKCGDVVKVTIGFNSHKARSNTEKPGLYVNPNAIMLWQVGKEIKGGEFDPNAAGFGPPPPQTPPPGATPPAPQPQQGQGYIPPRPPAPSPQPQPGAATPNPHTAFLQGPQPDPNPQPQ